MKRKKVLLISSVIIIAMVPAFICLNLLWRKTINNTRPTMKYESVWICREADWTFEVLDTSGETFGTVKKNGEEITVVICFLYSEIYVWYASTDYADEDCFSGDCIYYDDRFIVYNITKDELFNFEFSRITFDKE